MILIGKTDIGHRKQNEDTFFVCQGDGYGVAVVSDGMGGHAAGQTASQICADTLRELLLKSVPDEAALLESIRIANRNVFEAAAADPAKNGMGATLVAAVLFSDRFYAANVGDSRLYRYHNRAISQVTHDHSYVAELLRRKVITEEEARSHPNRNVILRAIGTDPDVNIDLFVCEWEANDMVLLCSDGLCDVLAEAEMEDILHQASDLDAACSILVKRALEGGSKDNITVVLAKNTEATI